MDPDIVAVTACLIWTASLDTPLSASWEAGPLPVELSQKHAQRAMADRQERETYFAARVCSTLYAAAADRLSGRWHYAPPSDQGAPPLRGWELLKVRGLPALLVAHVYVEGVSSASRLAEMSASFAARPRSDPAFVGLDGHFTQKPRRICHVTRPASGAAPLPDCGTVGFVEAPGWDWGRWWAWALGAGFANPGYEADTSRPPPGEQLYLSKDWTAHVLRDAIILTDVRPMEPETSLALNAYSRSLYLDSMLMALTQKAALESLADSLARCPLEDADPAAANHLLLQFLRIRSRYWWSTITRSGGHADRLMRSLQARHHLNELYAQLYGDVEDLTAYAEAKRRAREDADFALRETHDRHLSQLMGAIATVFLPWSLLFSMVSVLAEPNTGLFMAALFASGVVSLIMLAQNPGLRWWKPER